MSPIRVQIRFLIFKRIFKRTAQILNVGSMRPEELESFPCRFSCAIHAIEFDTVARGRDVQVPAAWQVMSMREGERVKRVLTSTQNARMSARYYWKNPTYERRIRATPQHRLAVRCSTGAMRGSADQYVSLLCTESRECAEPSPSYRPGRRRTKHGRLKDRWLAWLCHGQGREMTYPSGETSTRSTQLPPPLYDQPLSEILPS